MTMSDSKYLEQSVETEHITNKMRAPQNKFFQSMNVKWSENKFP